MTSDELLAWPVFRLLEAYRGRQVSPVEYLTQCLDQIERVNDTVNALGDLYPDEALETARVSERRWRSGEARPLEGVPVAVKDEASIAGKRTTYGSLLYEHYIATETEPMVRRLVDAGAVVHARSLTPEFAIAFFTHSRLWGVTRNPWNLAYDVGGSSGGSGAALASGMTPAATGSDIGGSIRVPASACGVVGYKPPHGRVPISGLYSLDDWCHQGPLARCVEDAALLADVMSGQDPADHTSLREPVRLGRPRGEVAGLRVGVSADLGDWPVVDEVRAAVDAAAASLAHAGALVEPVDLVVERELLARASDVHYREGFAADVAGDLRGHEDLVCPYTLKWVELVGSGTDTVLDGRRIESEICRRVDAVLDDYDVLLTASMAVPALAAGVDYTLESWRIGDTKYDTFHDLGLTEVFNVANRCPVLTVPAGRSGDGVPIGVQIVGRTYLDAPVFEVGLAVQEALDLPTVTVLPAGAA